MKLYKIILHFIEKVFKMFYEIGQIVEDSLEKKEKYKGKKHV